MKFDVDTMVDIALPIVTSYFSSALIYNPLPTNIAKIFENLTNTEAGGFLGYMFYNLGSSILAQAIYNRLRERKRTELQDIALISTLAVSVYNYGNYYENKKEMILNG
jgi:hypothetical protein